MSWRLAVTSAGWTATVALLVGYALVSSGRLAGDGRAYQVTNVLGSLGLGAAAFAGRVWPSVALNAVWAVIGIAALNRLRARAPGTSPARGRRQAPGQDVAPSTHSAPSAVSRTSTPIAASRSLTRSEVA